MSTPNLHLVEDSPADVELVEEALESLGYDVELTISKDGEEFLEYFNEVDREDSGETRPDLILLDIDLPRKNGFEILDRLRDNTTATLVPIVVLTMSNAADDLERCYELGANACVTKPLGFEAFEELLDSLLAFWLESAVVLDRQ